MKMQSANESTSMRYCFGICKDLWIKSNRATQYRETLLELISARFMGGGGGGFFALLGGGGGAFFTLEFAVFKVFE